MNIRPVGTIYSLDNYRNTLRRIRLQPTTVYYAMKFPENPKNNYIDEVTVSYDQITDQCMELEDTYSSFFHKDYNIIPNDYNHHYAFWRRDYAEAYLKSGETKMNDEIKTKLTVDISKYNADEIIFTLADAGHKIHAIKAARTFYKFGLKEAKDYVEAGRVVTSEDIGLTVKDRKTGQSYKLLATSEDWAWVRPINGLSETPFSLRLAEIRHNP